MPTFSQESEAMVATCHPLLQRVIREAIKLVDFKVIFGHRDVATQKALFDKGRSTLDGVTKKSMHNHDPSRAIDIAPYPVAWPDEKGIKAADRHERLRRFYVLAGVIMGVGHALGIPLRWGGDWDGDWTYSDQKFDDLGHFELKPVEDA